MRRLLRWCALLMFVITVPAAAHTRVALIVANGHYDVAPLDNPAVDAGLVEDALNNIGFDVTVMKDVSLEAFDHAIREFAARARGADLALFYYAGHGFAVSDQGLLRNYLMSIDADVTSTNERVLRGDGIPLDDIIQEISSQARTTLLFVDACRNDPRVSRAIGGRGRGAVPIIADFNESIFVGMSTRPGDVASDGEKGAGSPFARAFSAHIGEAGVRLVDAFTNIRLDVERQTGRAQRPDMGRNDLVAPVFLNVAAAPTTPLATMRAADPCRDAGAHWDYVNDRSDMTLIEEHIRLFPSCAFVRLARLRLEELRNPPETECDRFAASNADDSRPPSVAGIPFGKLDAVRATAACRAAVRSYPGVPRLEFQLGRALHKGNNLAEARDWYEKAAAAAHATAMYNLGDIYHTGSGVQQDYSVAREWFEKAAAHGDEIAMFNIGAFYDAGLGTSQDYAKAREWYLRAASHGSTHAMNNLGRLYELGLGVSKNLTQARNWRARAKEVRTRN